MECYHIIKGGIVNVVNEGQFKELYEPNGWVIDKNYHPNITEEEKVIKELKDETKIKNYTKSKKKIDTTFNDNLLKE